MKNLLLIIMVLVLWFGCIFVALTPEKDKFGDYTNFFKYWSSDEYICERFDNVPESVCNKLK